MGLNVLDGNIEAECSSPSESVETLILWVQPKGSENFRQDSPCLRLRDDNQLTMVHKQKHRTMVRYWVRLIHLHYCLQGAYGGARDGGQRDKACVLVGLHGLGPPNKNSDTGGSDGNSGKVASRLKRRLGFW